MPTSPKMCESCESAPAYRRVMLDGATFFVCQSCDMAALEAERRYIWRAR